MSRRYTLAALQAMPTIESGHFDNLKVQDASTRVWLSRMTTADGAKYDHGVTVEKLKAGVWVNVQEYQAR